MLGEAAAYDSCKKIEGFTFGVVKFANFRQADF
jgi:hypothetical protein